MWLVPEAYLRYVIETAERTPAMENLATCRHSSVVPASQEKHCPSNKEPSPSSAQPGDVDGGMLTNIAFPGFLQNTGFKCEWNEGYLHF